jgi:hypothetical protein
MAKRYSKAFFAGGVATLLLLLALLALAHMVLGMSDSAVSDSGFMEDLAAFSCALISFSVHGGFLFPRRIAHCGGGRYWRI